MYLSASLLALAGSALATSSSFLSTSSSWPTDVAWLHAMQKRAARKTCHVPALGGGQDDSSNIINAFSQCQNNSVIVLDGNYTGTLVFIFPLCDNVIEIVLVGRLLVTNFNNVEIQLTGSLQVCLSVHREPLTLPPLTRKAKVHQQYLVLVSQLAIHEYVLSRVVSPGFIRD